MKLTIDTEKKMLTHEEDGKHFNIDLYSKKAFELLSHEWLKLGWEMKYTYTFSWFGRPIIQIPEDMIRIQEVIYRVKPDIIIETGIAHGGSIIYFASLCKAMEKGKIIGVDIEIRPHNRKAIEEHELFPLITLIEGDSVSKNVVEQVKSLIKPEYKVLVILDSCHTKEHVNMELLAYSNLVTHGSYIVVTDGFMKNLYDVPRGNRTWKKNNPYSAIIDFTQKNTNFIIEQPEWPFNESSLDLNITHWPGAFLKREDKE